MCGWKPYPCPQSSGTGTFSLCRQRQQPCSSKLRKIVIVVRPPSLPIMTVLGGEFGEGGVAQRKQVGTHGNARFCGSPSFKILTLIQIRSFNFPLSPFFWVTIVAEESENSHTYHNLPPPPESQNALTSFVRACVRSSVIVCVWFYFPRKQAAPNLLYIPYF